MRRACLIPAVLLAGSAAFAPAASINWTGGVSNDWGTAGNWSGTNTPPLATDTILLGDAAVTPGLQTIDLNGNRTIEETPAVPANPPTVPVAIPVIPALTMMGTGGHSYLITSSAPGGSVLSSTLNNAVGVSATATAASLTLDSSVTLQSNTGGTNFFVLDNSSTVTKLILNSNITFTGASARLGKTGVGLLRINSALTGASQLNFSGGEVVLGNGNALGTALIAMNNNVARTLTLTGDTTLGVASANTISGTGTGADQTNRIMTIRLAESGANDRTLTINGRLAASKIVIGANEAGSTGKLTLLLKGDNASTGFIETIAGTTVKLVGAGSYSAHSGGIEGPGNVVINPTGTVYNSAGVANSTVERWTYTGSTQVLSGRFIVNSPLPGTSGVTVEGTGSLGGTSSITNGVIVKAGGMIAPGSLTSPAGSGSAAGTLTVGSLDLQSGSTLAFQLGATSDLLTVGGAITASPGGLTFNNVSGSGVPSATYTLASGASVSGYVPGLSGVGSFTTTGTVGTKKFLFGGSSNAITVTVSDAVASLSSGVQVNSDRGTIDASSENHVAVLDGVITSGHVDISGLAPPNQPVLVALDLKDSISQAQAQALFTALSVGTGFTLERIGSLWTTPDTTLPEFDVGADRLKYDLLFGFAATGTSGDPLRYFNFDLGTTGGVNRVALVAAVPEPASVAVAAVGVASLLGRRRGKRFSRS